MRTLEQERALFAWERINSVCMEHPTQAKDVAMHIKKMPSMVLANGLGQALAFLLQKDEGKRSGPEYSLRHDCGVDCGRTQTIWGPGLT